MRRVNQPLICLLVLFCPFYSYELRLRVRLLCFSDDTYYVYAINIIELLNFSCLNFKSSNKTILFVSIQFNSIHWFINLVIIIISITFIIDSFIRLFVVKPNTIVLFQYHHGNIIITMTIMINPIAKL